MSLWTWFGLTSGSASTDWPRKGDTDGQQGVLGIPRYDPVQCRQGCNDCERACVTHAITAAPDGQSPPAVDWGKCIVCQRCTEVCPTGAFSPSHDWAVGVTTRDELHWVDRHALRTEGNPGRQDKRPFQRSLHVRHVDAGSCNGCESELQALNNPFYNLHRLGIFFTPSPRFADVLLVTGPVTHAMKRALLEAYDAMPEPRWVIATGTCAVSGGVSGGNYACGTGLSELLPVDLYLPGCPPNPAAIIHALLMLLGRAEQRVKGGQIER
jgi:formate hydrogenlyase subunit 7